MMNEFCWAVIELATTNCPLTHRPIASYSLCVNQLSDGTSHGAAKLNEYERDMIYTANFSLLWALSIIHYRQ